MGTQANESHVLKLHTALQRRGVCQKKFRARGPEALFESRTGTTRPNPAKQQVTAYVQSGNDTKALGLDRPVFIRKWSGLEWSEEPSKTREKGPQWRQKEDSDHPTCGQTLAEAIPFKEINGVR